MSPSRSAISSTRLRISAFGVRRTLQAVAEVLPDAHVRVERVALEDHGDVAVARREVGDVAASDRDLAARHVLETGDRAQEGRLAAAGRADERDELAVRDLQGDVVEREDVAREGLRDVAKLDLGHRAGYGYHISPQLVLTTGRKAA